MDNENYVTVLDSLFLPQALALHCSMERVLQNYKLWIVCVDNEAFQVLSQLNLQNIKILDLQLFETEELLAAKQTRSSGEYCWTLTPFSARFVFEIDSTVERVTYIDADMWFRKKPKPIFDEFDASGKHVLITDHGYAPDYDQSTTSGQFCVQFITFTRRGSEHVRQWWEERCVEWCFARFEEGKFGDQKYLDDWPERYKDNVHVLNDKELTLAPWNASRFPYGNAVFYHFHDLRIISEKHIQIDSNYNIPYQTFKNIHVHYITDIKNSIESLMKIGYLVRPQVKKKYKKEKIYT